MLAPLCGPSQPQLWAFQLPGLLMALEWAHEVMLRAAAAISTTRGAATMLKESTGIKGKARAPDALWGCPTSRPKACAALRCELILRIAFQTVFCCLLQLLHPSPDASCSLSLLHKMRNHLSLNAQLGGSLPRGHLQSGVGASGPPGTTPPRTRNPHSLASVSLLSILGVRTPPGSWLPGLPCPVACFARSSQRDSNPV